MKQIKKLVLKREDVKQLVVRTNVHAGFVTQVNCVRHSVGDTTSVAGACGMCSGGSSNPP
jgi:hypothetical protein